VTETDEKKWTSGKRRAESDPLVGPAFLTTIQGPSITSHTEAVLEEEVAGFALEVGRTEVAVKALHAVATDIAAKYRGEMKRDMQAVGRAFSCLGAAVGGRVVALSRVGELYEELGIEWEKQAAIDWQPLVHVMHDYRGLTAGWQGLLGLYSTIREKGREVLANGGEREKDMARDRTNTYTVAVAAEMRMYKQELDIDLNRGSRAFLTEQIKFHRMMADKLEALQRECWNDEGHQSGPPIYKQTLPPVVPVQGPIQSSVKRPQPPHDPFAVSW